MTAVCVRAAGQVVGPANVEEVRLPSMGGEDFSGYLKHVPGCLLRLGVASLDRPRHPLHSPHFDIDEDAPRDRRQAPGPQRRPALQRTRKAALVSLFKFVMNERPTLGVEIELNLVDSRTMALRSAVSDVLADSAPRAGSVDQARVLAVLPGDQHRGLRQRGRSPPRPHWKDRRRSARPRTATTFGSTGAATHPFSRWQDQEVTPNDRYYSLIELLQETARRLVTFGLHVHVGVDSGDKAIMICDRIMQHLPILLALSVNSPFWQGRNTGLHSQRIKVMETLPTAGLPPLMRNWSEYAWLLNHMVETGFIKTIREIWWDVRPHHNFGTVEVRICDMPPSLRHVLGLTALVQCLVHDLSEEIDRGTYQYDCHPVHGPAEQVASLPLRDGGQAGGSEYVPGHSGPTGRAFACGPARRSVGGARVQPLSPRPPRAGRAADRRRTTVTRLRGDP